MSRYTTFLENYYFYYTHHKNVYNKIIHIITVPLITWSVFVFLNYTPSLWIFPSYSIVVFMLYGFYWISIQPLAGIAGIAFYIPVWYISIVYNLNCDSPYIGGIVAFTVGWVAQIIGHKCIEKNNPAFFKSLIQAFLTAPLFIVCELLFSVGMLQDIKNNIDNYTELCDSSSFYQMSN